ncbi:CHC2-type zinc finger protein, partial [Candidatus Endoriftia persephone str. Guaymas]|nr:CHC2-type zinc finger protein [Candidatus Endoriftia persephone str. Guaymas]
RSLLGKVVRASLKPGAKGTLMRESLPRFPMLQWLQFLAKHYDRSQIQEIYGRYRKRCLDLSRASGDDDGAVRMAGNYAAVLMAWRLLCEFAGVEESQGDFPQDVLHEMNEHISETSQDREPWVWIMEIALSEIDRGEFRYPHMFDSVQDDERVDVECLLVRTSNIMDHIAHSPALRDRWNALPVKSDRVFKRQLRQAGVIVAENKERV